MKILADCQSYADAQMQFSPERLWELFDGDRAALNIAHECVDQGLGPGGVPVHLRHHARTARSRQAHAQGAGHAEGRGALRHGPAPGERFLCPSSPAWGHGLWHGTLAPLALGLTVGACSGRFNAERLLQGLSAHGFTNMSAAATHYRMMKNSGKAGDHRYALRKLSFTGEPRRL